MLLRMLACASLLLAPSSVAPATTEVMPGGSAIQRVLCEHSAGTMFRVGPHIGVSAQHVTGDSECTANGERLDSRRDGDLDVSIMVLKSSGPYLKMDCGGFVAGRKYIAIGYGRGMPVLTEVRMIGTGKKITQFNMLFGIFTLQPGHSGSPIIDYETGKVVGVGNIAEWRSGLSGSIALKDTSLCHS